MNGCVLARFVYDVRAAEKESTSVSGRGKVEFRRNYNATHDANEFAGLHQASSSNWADA
jgi:hypothetical protein